MNIYMKVQVAKIKRWFHYLKNDFRSLYLGKISKTHRYVTKLNDVNVTVYGSWLGSRYNHVTRYVGCSCGKVFYGEILEDK